VKYEIKKWVYSPENYPDALLYAFATNEWARAWHESRHAFSSNHFQIWRAAADVIETSDTRKYEFRSRDAIYMRQYWDNPEKYSEFTDKPVPLGTVYCARLALLELAYDYPPNFDLGNYSINIEPIIETNLVPLDRRPIFWQSKLRYGQREGIMAQ
jgi:hypothetical protein